MTLVAPQPLAVSQGCEGCEANQAKKSQHEQQMAATSSATQLPNRHSRAAATARAQVTHPALTTVLTTALTTALTTHCACT